MNHYGEDLELDFDEKCDYVLVNQMFDWYCSLPAHPSMPNDHYMTPAAHSPFSGS